MRIRSTHLFCALLCAAVAAPVSAGTFPLSFTADDSSRWYDFIMDWFAQLDRTGSGSPPPNILYQISAEADPLHPATYHSSGDSAVVFAHGRAFADVGSITYTGSGNGTFPITAVTLDINPHVRTEDASALGLSYLTTVSNPQGTIKIAGGAVTDIQLSADIRFDLDARNDPLIGYLLPYDGTLLMDGDRFDIFVDDTAGSHFVMRYVWDLHGSVDGVGGGDTVFKNGFDAG